MDMTTALFDSETLNCLTQELYCLSWQYYKENNSQIIDKVQIYQEGNINVVVNLSEDEVYMYEPIMEDLISACNTAFILSEYMDNYSLSVITKTSYLVGIYGEFQNIINTDL